MKTRAIILAGGEGARLGVLTAKRTKPAVPFGGKYRIIDFTLSNCVNSDLYDVMIIAQYRPHSLLEHVGAGTPWDLNRDLIGGVRIYPPYTGRRSHEWFTGTADAIQQNFSFIKRNNPDLVLVLSGDHIYTMDYEPLITFHLDHQADLTMATIRVGQNESRRFGIVGIEDNYRVTAFIEKPQNPPSDLANMGVYIFSTEFLNHELWEDHSRVDSSHDFGKDIIPKIVQEGARVFAYPFSGYWVDVGTINSYWKAHMDLLKHPPSIDLNNRSWVIHTRTEERPPVQVYRGAEIADSMLSDGCVIEEGAYVEHCVLSPGVVVHKGASVKNSVILTDTHIGENVSIDYAIIDKRSLIGANSQIGGNSNPDMPELATVGKNSLIPPGLIVENGAAIGADIIPEEIEVQVVRKGEYVQSKRLPIEI